MCEPVSRLQSGCGMHCCRHAGLHSNSVFLQRITGGTSGPFLKELTTGLAAQGRQWHASTQASTHSLTIHCRAPASRSPPCRPLQPRLTEDPAAVGSPRARSWWPSRSRRLRAEGGAADAGPWRPCTCPLMDAGLLFEAFVVCGLSGAEPLASADVADAAPPPVASTAGRQAVRYRPSVVDQLLGGDLLDAGARTGGGRAAGAGKRRLPQQLAAVRAEWSEGVASGSCGGGGGGGDQAPAWYAGFHRMARRT